MLTAEARVETERSSRYLVQLCKHVSEIGRANPEMQARVEWAEDRGLIEFDWGRCTLGALPYGLILRAEATDEEHLRQIEQRLAGLLERIGRHDHLRVAWTAPQGDQEHPQEAADRNHGGRKAHG